MLQILSVLRPDDMGSFVFGCVVASVVWFSFMIVIMFFMSASEGGRRADEMHEIRRQEMLLKQGIGEV